MSETEPNKEIPSPSAPMQQGSSPAPVSGPDRFDDLARDLEEFDRANTPQKPSGGDAPQVEAAKEPGAPQAVAATKKQMGKSLHLMRDPGESLKHDLATDSLMRWASGVEQHLQALGDARKAELDQKDFENIVKLANESLPADKVLPENFARYWLMHRMATDGRLTSDLNNRYANDEANARAESQIKKALREMHNEIARMPDADATESRRLIVAAMTRGTVTPPEKKPPNYAQMSDQEFVNTVDKDFGYRPGVA